MQILLDEGVDPDSADRFVGTDLVRELINVDEGVERMLVAAIDSVDVIDYDTHRSVLMRACESGQVGAVKMLLDAGADVNMCVEDRTALMDACRIGQIGIVKMLLDAGADVNISGKGSTALMDACRIGQIDIVKMLLDAGANVNECTSSGPGMMGVPEGVVGSMGLLLNAGDNANDGGYVVDTPLSLASDRGFDQVVRMLVFAHANVNTKLRFAGSALHLASNDGFKHVVEALIEAGADVDAQGGEYVVDPAQTLSPMTRSAHPLVTLEETYQATALQLACSAGHVTVLNVLLQANANVNAGAGTPRTVTALQWACRSGNELIVRSLLDAGADVNAVGLDGTALQLASWKGSEVVVQMLLEARADVNASALPPRRTITGLEKDRRWLSRIASSGPSSGQDFGVTALQFSAIRGNKSVGSLLLAAGADVDAQGIRCPHPPLLLALARGKPNLHFTQMLLERGARVGADIEWQHHMLYLAAREGNEEMTRILLEKGIAPDIVANNGRTALHGAAWRGHVNVVKMLLDAGADVDAETEVIRQTPLQKASQAGRSFVLKCLLSFGANINARDLSSFTAMHWACYHGHEKAVQILLDAGANINAQAGVYGTPLQQAAGKGHKMVVQMFLDAGADLKNEAGCPGEGTSLQRAARNGHATVVRMLLVSGADIEARSQQCDRTALQLASWEGFHLIVRMLLEQGANIIGGTGPNALELALYRGHKLVIMALRDAGIDVDNADVSDHCSWLQQAAADGDIWRTHELLMSNADVEGTWRRGQRCHTPLQEASEGGHKRIVRDLLRAGAQVNGFPRDVNPLSPIQLAAKGGHQGVVKTLLRWKAFVDHGVGYEHQRTPLQWASWKGYEGIVQMLLDAGANVHAEGNGIFDLDDGGNGNALQLASRAGHQGVVKILRAAGATHGKLRHFRRWTFGSFLPNSSNGDSDTHSDTESDTESDTSSGTYSDIYSGRDSSSDSGCASDGYSGHDPSSDSDSDSDSDSIYFPSVLDSDGSSIGDPIDSKGAHQIIFKRRRSFSEVEWVLSDRRIHAYGFDLDEGPCPCSPRQLSMRECGWQRICQRQIRREVQPDFLHTQLGAGRESMANAVPFEASIGSQVKSKWI